MPPRTRRAVLMNYVESPVTPEPKGRAKSGRVWKTDKKRASSMIKTKSKVGRVGAEKNRESRKSVKILSEGIKSQMKTDAAEKREREANNRRRREEASKKAEIVQVIHNSGKLRNLKKKSLRPILKRDTTLVDDSAKGNAKKLNFTVVEAPGKSTTKKLNATVAGGWGRSIPKKLNVTVGDMPDKRCLRSNSRVDGTGL